MTRAIQDAVSLWDFSAPQNATYSALEGDQQTSVAIVGGGFTGLSTALHLAERGVSCRVLEGMHIGYGGSGRNFGLVNPGLWLTPDAVKKAVGEQHADRFMDLMADAPRYVFSIIDKYNIECEDTRTGTIHAAHSPAGMAELTQRAEDWAKLGTPVDLLDRDQVSEKIGAPAFHGGLLDRRAGTINPMGYVRGLARAASDAGATIHTETKVTALSQTGGGWLVTTQNGATLKADSVILGTNAYTDELWPGLKNSFTPIHYYMIATEPLGEQASDILRERQGVWDTGKIMFSVRRDAFGRIILGGMGKIVDPENGLSRRWAERNIKRLFPDLENVQWQKGWHGQIAMTPDHVLKINRLAPGLYTPIGYNGRGITTGTVFGKAMAELLISNDEKALPLPVTDPEKVLSAPIMSRLYETAFRAKQIYKSL